jgi:hypothetical protein
MNMQRQELDTYPGETKCIILAQAMMLEISELGQIPFQRGNGTGVIWVTECWITDECIVVRGENWGPLCLDLGRVWEWTYKMLVKRTI